MSVLKIKNIQGQWTQIPSLKGTDGVSPNLQIGTVETLPSGSQATASVTGTQAVPVLNLGLPTAPLNCVAYTEASSVATRMYDIGDYVIYNDTLYKITKTIPAGGSIVPNTNAIATDVSDELSTLGINQIISKSDYNLITELTNGEINVYGNIVSSNDYYVTDYIPIENSIPYCQGGIYRNMVCDSNKGFIQLNYGQPFFSDNIAYIRLCIKKANVEAGNFYFCKYDDYNSWTYSNGYAYINELGTDILNKNIVNFANAENRYFSNGENLYNYYDDIVYFSSAGDGARTTGYGLNIDKDQAVRSGGTVFVNGVASIFKYMPCEYGEAVFCNYTMDAVVFYDTSKEPISESLALPPQSGAVAPSGTKYIRINLRTHTSADDTIHAISDLKNVFIYKVTTNNNIAPVPISGQQSFQIDGVMVSPNYLDKVTPNMVDSNFLSAMKCLTIREINSRANAWRFGNFNMWVMMTVGGWQNTKQMLMDYGLDFCGLEEVTLVNGRKNVDIATYMKSWQFAGGFIPDRTAETVCNKSFISRFPLVSQEEFIFEHAPVDQKNNRSCIRCVVNLPRFLDIYDPIRTLAVYVFHGPITTAIIQEGVAADLLAKIAMDTSDFIVIMGDTNDFGDSAENKTLWNAITAGGFTPVLPIESKTCTQDIYSDVDQQARWRKQAIDQFFVSDNIDVLGYGVQNTKDKYAVIGGYKSTATDNEYALSDHDFVWCDLKFNYDTPRTIVPVSTD